MYLLTPVEQTGGLKLFWKIDGKGYTTNIDLAGRFSAAEGIRHCRESGLKVQMMLEEEAESRSIRVVPQ